MTSSPRMLTTLATCAVLLLGSTALARNQNEQRLDVTLAPSLFANSEAIGDATYSIRRHRADFEVEVEDLLPGVYQLFVGGVLRGELTVVPVAKGTQGVIEYSTTSQLGKFPLSFDPRGSSIEIRSATAIILQGFLAETPNPEAPVEDASFGTVNDKVELRGSQGNPAAGTAVIKSSRKKATLTFKLKNLPTVAHTITANQVPIAEFTPSSRGAATIVFSTAPRKDDLLLDFDPSDTTFEVLSNGAAILTGAAGGQPIGGGASTIGELRQVFNASGPDRDASGGAKFRDRATRFDFEVEAEDLPVGDYAVVVGGSAVATMAVRSTDDGTEGEVEFSTDSSERGKLPLTFDPRGQTIQIVQNQTVYLSMSFPQ